MDRTKRCRTSDHGEIEKNQMPIENGKMGSGKTRKCGDENLVYLDELGKIDGQMGIAIR